MSLFGTSPPPGSGHANSLFSSPQNRPSALFDSDNDSEAPEESASSDLFAPNHTRSKSKSKSRAEILRSFLLGAAPLPEKYGEFWAEALKEAGGDASMLGEQVVDRVLDDAMIEGTQRKKIKEIVVPSEGDIFVGRGEFNLLLALVALVQDGDEPSLDVVARRRNDLPTPRFLDPILKNHRDELAAKPPQKATTTALFKYSGDSHSSSSAASDSHSDSASDRDAGLLSNSTDYHASYSPHSHSHLESSTHSQLHDADADDNKADADSDNNESAKGEDEEENEDHSESDGGLAGTMNAAGVGAPVAVSSISSPQLAYPESDDPWGSLDVHKGQNHLGRPDLVGSGILDSPSVSGGISMNPEAQNSGMADSQTLGNTQVSSAAQNPIVAATQPYQPASPRSTNAIRHGSIGSPGAAAPWSYYDNGGFGEPVNPFGTPSPFRNNAANGFNGGLGAGLGSATKTKMPEETIQVTLLPEKEGIFLFQHHNYEVSSSRRGSKVIRRYSDFVWLLGCLHQRYPFRALPMLPPKRVALNGNHLSNDGAFIEKRRRGLARFLNAIVAHPVFAAEQLVIMFLTVPTELSVWRKQATISVQDEFSGRELLAGLEESLPAGPLEELFARTRAGIRRSADMYIGVCNIMDRLVKRTEGVAADHARIALSLISLTESNADVYATDGSDVLALNTGLQNMSRHLRTAQSLLEDESRAWEAGVLEDLKRQRDVLVALRNMFERRDALDRDNIPALEKRIIANENKIASLRTKPAGTVKAGEIERLCEAVGADKAEIVWLRNRRIFVRECLRDELRYAMSSVGMVTRWCQEWAQERVKYAEMMADNWRSLIDGLEGMPTGE